MCFHLIDSFVEIFKAIYFEITLLTRMSDRLVKQFTTFVDTMAKRPNRHENVYDFD